VFNKISIIGGGEIGKAISYIAGNNGVSVSLWDKDPAKSTASSADECFTDTEAVFFCVPSWGLRGALSEFEKDIPSGIPLVLISKGLEKDTGLSAPEIVASMLPDAEVVFIGGPMIAEEIVSGKGCHAVVGGHEKFALMVAEIFDGPNISVELADDALSLALLGVMKNVYAMVIGAAEGSGKGGNMRSYLFSKAVLEMAGAVEILHGDGSKAFGAAGIGDLMATATGEGSSNRKAGFAFAEEGQPEKVSEGMTSVEEVVKRMGEEIVTEMELLSFARSMVKNKSVDPGELNDILL
jgi:glycerol-3-phosphate dehydrogenase (NAD(P)+)